jgi:hypothetical protein
MFAQPTTANGDMAAALKELKRIRPACRGCSAADAVLLCAPSRPRPIETGG